MRKFLIKNWGLLTVIVLTLSITWPLFLPGYFSHHDDLQVMRIFEMRRCFADFQIPCRWVPDMGYGNGFPLFNYYNVLPYYLGGIFSFVFGFIGSAKILFFIPAVLGGLTMFFLGEELFGLAGGITASVLFTFAPYRALDLYVRGDVTESFAIALVPMVFFLALKALRKNKLGYFLAFAVSFGLVLLSHNIMSIFFGPFLILWILFWMLVDKKINLWPKFLMALLLGVGLSAFFVLPAFFEKGYVQIDNLIKGALNFRSQFVEVNQLFISRFWGYGASVPGPNDTISFQIGWPHWWLVVIGLLVGLGSALRIIKIPKRIKALLGLLIVVFLFSAFMTHNRSDFIWEKIPLLAFVQFPWRFLAVSIFSASLVGGLLVGLLGKNKWIVVLVIAILTFVLNFSYFRPGEFLPNITDAQKLSGQLWVDQQKAAITDYLPDGAVIPTEEAPSLPIVRSGQANITNFDVHSNSFSFPVNVTQSSSLEIPIFYFPNWKVFSNGQTVPISHNNSVDRITINLASGNYQITGRLENTTLRTVSNLISLACWLGLVIFLVDGKIRKVNR